MAPQSHGAAASDHTRVICKDNPTSHFVKYLRKKLTQLLTPKRPSSTKPGARFARANPVVAGPLWSQILSQYFA